MAKTSMCSGEGGILPEEKVTEDIATIIEQNLEYCVYARPGFITIDGRGGATGSSPLFLKLQIMRESMQKCGNERSFCKE